jgi:hypothetical protein
MLNGCCELHLLPTTLPYTPAVQCSPFTCYMMKKVTGWQIYWQFTRGGHRYSKKYRYKRHRYRYRLSTSPSPPPRTGLYREAHPFADIAPHNPLQLTEVRLNISSPLLWCELHLYLREGKEHLTATQLQQISSAGNL